MRQEQKGSVAAAKNLGGGEVEVPIVLMQRGRAAKETTARMSSGMARELMEGSERG